MPLGEQSALLDIANNFAGTLMGIINALGKNSRFKKKEKASFSKLKKTVTNVGFEYNRFIIYKFIEAF